MFSDPNLVSCWFAGAKQAAFSPRAQIVSVMGTFGLAVSRELSLIAPNLCL